MVKLIHKLHNCEVDTKELKATITFDNIDDMNRFIELYQSLDCKMFRVTQWESKDDFFNSLLGELNWLFGLDSWKYVG